MAQLALSRGLCALVDDEDLERLSQWSWCVRPPSTRSLRWYAFTEMNGRTAYLHRFILDAAVGTEVDHINGDGLDCRRTNMRLATRSQNEANKVKADSPKWTSRYKGVSLVPTTGRWRAALTLNRRRLHVGIFATEGEAAKAYDAAAIAAWGQFALVNFPGPGQ